MWWAVRSIWGSWDLLGARWSLTVDGKTYGPYFNNTVAAGSMISSVSDMARFIQMMNARGQARGGRVLKTETVEAMITRQNGSIPLDFDFPLGYMWKLYDPELAYAGRFCEHSGDAMIMSKAPSRNVRSGTELGVSSC